MIMTDMYWFFLFFQTCAGVQFHIKNHHLLCLIWFTQLEMLQKIIQPWKIMFLKKNLLWEENMLVISVEICTKESHI